MKRVNISKLKQKDLLDNDALRKSFEAYLGISFDYTPEEAKIASTDLIDPYSAPYVVQDFEGEYTIDGTVYSVYACRTEFRLCGLFHLAYADPFKFYMFIDKSTLKDQTVGSYIKASKLYYC